MANPGVGTKFVSVNLNKSYGQQQQYHHHHHNNNQHHSSSYGLSNRSRTGGSGSMVVLSRPRSSQKAAGAKLSVPPPLNLPSLRKEHERFDSLGSGGGPAAGGIGNGARPSSSGMGWTKPAAISIQEKQVDNTVDETCNSHGVGHGLVGVNGVTNGHGNSSVYAPPSARTVMPTVSVPSGGYSVTEKATVLSGEDFPSLQATLPPTSGPEKKQKDGLNQKQKQVLGEELANDRRNGSQSSDFVDIGSKSQSRNNISTGLRESAAETRGSVGSVIYERDRKHENYFLGSLPLVQLNPRSDWADDERDTGHGLADRGRDHGFSKAEACWETDYDFPRRSILPQKPGHNLFDRRIQRDNETGKFSSSEVTDVDTHGKDVRMSAREGQEGNSWRASSPHPFDGFTAQETGNGRSGISMKASLNREATRLPFRDYTREDLGRRDVGYGQTGRQPWNNKTHSFGIRGYEGITKERHGSEQYNRNRGDVYQNNSPYKSSYSFGGKGLSINDPILNFGNEKRPFSKNEKPYLEDPFAKDFGSNPFDGQDPFSGAFPPLVKKKKDVLKQTDFHDPVRESFEAELEKVQKMQEQERQRASEEHDRAMELARREEEEKMRLAREQEERQRRLEEERLEAMQRAEQERLESVRRAEEQRIAREEEKHRILMEEDRRRQAAKQKLMELEERIAKREAEAKNGNTGFSGVTDEKMSGVLSEKDVSNMPDGGEWEDNERMVERITTSASSDSSGLNKPLEMASRPHFPRNNTSDFLDRGKVVNTWKRDVFENGNNPTFFPQDLENCHHGPRHDASAGGRTFSRKEFYGGPGYIPSRSYHKGGIPDAQMDDLSQIKGQRWNISGDGNHYGRTMEMEPEFHDNLTERLGDIGWAHGRSRGNSFPQNHERVYQNPEADGIYNFGRSRYSLRQPRVLPPPTMNSMLRNPYRPESDRPGPSTYPESELQYSHSVRNEPSMHTRYDGNHQENVERPERIDTQQEHTENEARMLNRSMARCDSQSSLSVSSPPDSPVHLSQDDLDECADSQALSGSEGNGTTLLEQQNESETLPIEADKENMVSGSSVVSSGDDDEWTIENDQQLQEQEDYDEGEDGYEEEDEVHDGEDDKVNLVQNFEDMIIEGKSSPDMMDNLVLGFNEGVEVGMPNDEFERCSRSEETKFVTQHVSVEKQGPFDGMLSDGQTRQHVDGSDQLTVENSSRIFQETEKALQDLAIQPKHAPPISATSEFLNHVDASSGSGLTRPQIPSSSAETVMSSAPSVLCHPEGPVKLQFGLFSGPPLIPSPVSAIQIGSIQMPLNLHGPVGPSLTNIHPSQPPLFQFGQLRYTSPISQGVLPLTPQSLSFVHPSVPTNFSLNHNVGGSLAIHPQQDTSSIDPTKSDPLSVSVDNQPGVLPRNLDVSHGLVSKEGISSPLRGSADDTVKMQQRQGEISHITYISDHNSDYLFVDNFKVLPNKELEGQTQTGATSSQTVYEEKDLGASRDRGLTSGGRGRKYSFAMKNYASKSIVHASENSHQDSTGLQRPRRQRTEFRVRENSDKRQSAALVPPGSYGMDDKSNNGGRVTGSRSISRRVVIPNRKTKQSFELEGLNSWPVDSREVDTGSKAEKGAGKEYLRKNQGISHSGEDVDAALQSGVVRVFEQHGIETPSDDDDFIEVRSKRQMLNYRREQRKKEIKAKSRVSKMPRKPRATSQNATASGVSNKIAASVGVEAPISVHTDLVGNGDGLAKVEVSGGYNTPIASQPLPPIGTPALKADAAVDMRSQTIKSFQTGSIPVVSGGGKNLATGLIFDSKNNILDNSQTSLGSWGNSQINHQVMALTRAQIDEALKPAQFGSHSSVGDPSKSISVSTLPLSSISTKEKSFSTKEKSFSSTTSPINSLLAGEKIQFGAVTSPTILPPSSHAVSHGIGPPGPCQSDIQISHNLSAAENECSIFFKKEKHPDASCAHLADCEAEAEAAASAIAVAAISSDEIMGSGLGTGPVSASDSKTFGIADADGLSTGVSGNQQLLGQSRAEESLSVALPADLSVETTPISLWPPLPSPQNSSSQMISHVPGGTHSHFPFYEMNPMLGGPIFALGPPDESASTKPQPQKSNTSVSGPPGTWQHHSGVDSFYGPPAGFTAPFISPPGSIPGVQGPPHMVVYNHFAPVGQFGQVGLSFMGTTYIPSGKQPDWKHNPASSAVSVGEGDVNNLNMVSAQRNPTNMPTPIQHLAPGSPLLPMASPLAMFDASPFQSASDMSVQARWSHVPASPLQSVPMSMPLQQKAEVAPSSSQFNHGPSIDQPLPNRFQESCTTTPSEKNLPTATDADAAQLPDELGLVDSSSSNSAGTLTHSVVKSSSASTIMDAGKMDGVQNGSGANGSGQSTSSAFKAQPSHRKSASAQHYSNSSGYNYQRGGVSHKNSSGEWSHRRMGYQGRNQSLGAEKSFPPPKLKQIYVAKQTTSGASATS